MPEDLNQNDHDILIELRTVFREFRSEQSGNWTRMHEKLTSVFHLLDQKADKLDLSLVKDNQTKILGRISALEDGHKTESGTKLGYKKVIDTVLKIWGVSSGFIFLLMGIYDFFIK